MIKIYDNFMNLDDMTDLYTMSVTANYEIGWDDTSTIENRQYPCLHSDLNLLELERYSPYFKLPELEHTILEKAVINLTMPSSVNFRHTHGESRRCCPLRRFHCVCCVYCVHCQKWSPSRSTSRPSRPRVCPYSQTAPAQPSPTSPQSSHCFQMYHQWD